MGTSEGFAAWYALYTVVLIPVVFGNSLILVSIAKTKKLQNKMNLLVANLAAADLIIGLVVIPVDIIGDITGFKVLKYYCIGKLSVFILSLGSTCLNLLLISVERFVAVVFPLHKHRYLSRTRLYVIISIIWIVSIADSVVPFIGWNNYPNNGSIECVSDDVWASGYMTYNNWMLVVVNVTNTVLYVVVVTTALRRASATSIGRNMSINISQKRDLNHLKTMIIIFGLFAICWLPYTCLIVVITFYETPRLQLIRRLMLIPGVFNSAINWIVYGYRSEEYRKAFRTILCCRDNSDEQISSRAGMRSVQSPA